jgi:hypothetical protein
MGSCSLAAVSAAARDRAWVNICEEIDSAIKEPRESRRPFPSIADKLHLLREVQFGRRVAEDEAEFLAKYFVETNSWRQIFNNEVDVVYGAKGAGKSALYSLLVARSGELFDRNVLLVPAENPRGTPVFSGLVTDPPASQREFVGLWKLYISGNLDNFGSASVILTRAV